MQINVTKQNTTIVAATDDSADQDSGAYYAGAITPAVYTITCDETAARYIRWRMYKAKQEDGPRRRATAIHAALAAAGVPA